MKRVCVLNTGGTIGMVRTSAGYSPREGFLERYMESMSELAHPDVPGYEVVNLPPLLDSADMRPEDWVRIAEAIGARYDDYDGFVVVHGTDTMAYTASALSFLLDGLGRPVVLTGSQLPLSHVRTDGREHLITSLILAADPRIHEVCIYFGARLLRGNRAQKVHASDFAAFQSGNLPPLARVGAEIEVATHLLLPPGRGLRDTLGLLRSPDVAAVRLYPGISAALLERVLAPPTEAVVLETYGAGNFPSRDPELLAVVREATRRGVIVVNCSQAHGGRVRQDLYSTGSALAEAGAVSGHDMTAEAALTKLYVLLGRGVPPDRVRTLVGRSLAGELTLRHESELEDKA